MTVVVTCPACGKTAKVAEEHLGRTAKCPKCAQPFTLERSVPESPPIIAEEVYEAPAPPPIPRPASPAPTAIPTTVIPPKSTGIFGSVFGGKSTDVGLIESYSVVYLGGHPDYPKAKAAKIEMKIFPDRFEFLPTFSSKKWFKGIIIPFASASNLQIVNRQIGTMEGLLGGLRTTQLNQPNNIHITYDDPIHGETLLRVEMLSGVTVMGQAKKCQEFMDRVRVNRIVEKFKPKAQPGGTPSHGDDIPAQIEKLAALRDKGILTQAEFDTKKAALLAKM